MSMQRARNHFTYKQDRNILFYSDEKTWLRLSPIDTVKNICQELRIFIPPPPTNEIYDMHKLTPQNDAAALVFHTVETVTVPKQPRLTGVYGYDDDNNLVEYPEGRIYNDSFDEFTIKCHTAPRSEANQFDIDNLLYGAEKIVNYLLPRGFQLPPPDATVETENAYSAFTFKGNSGASVTLNFVGGANPTHVDLGYNVVFGSIALLTAGIFPEFKPEAERSTGFVYPRRIPITQNCSEYAEKLGKEPIAFYSQNSHQLTIDVPSGDEVLSWNNPNYLGGPGTLHMGQFHGTFTSLKRDRDNQLVLAPIREADLFVQASDLITFEIRVTTEAGIVNSLRSAQIPRLTPSGFYNGLNIPKMNHGPELDILAPQQTGSILGGVFTANLNPMQTSETLIDNNIFATGDNPLTPLVERFSGISYIFISDPPIPPKPWLDAPTSIGFDWSKVGTTWDISVLTNPPIPEDIINVDEPTFLIQESIKVVIGKLFMTTVHVGTNIRALDLQAHAVAYELIPEINEGTIGGTGRTVSASGFHSVFSRGLWAWGRVDGSTNLADTSGIAYIYDYLFKNHDTLQQADRRALDILSTEYADSLFDTGLEYYLEQVVNSLNFAGGPYYGGARRLSYQQAYDEILNKDFSDIFVDASIMSALLRNNESIPEKYRCTFPHWLSSRENPYSKTTDPTEGSGLLTTGITQPSVEGDVTMTFEVENAFNFGPDVYLENIDTGEAFGIYEFVSRGPDVNSNTFTATYSLKEIVQGKTPGTSIPAGTQVTLGDMSTWWSKFDNNEPEWNPRSAAPPLGGITQLDPLRHHIPTLGAESVELSVEDLATGIWILDNSLTSVQVNITKGDNWRATVVQYNKIDPTGDFQQLPSVGDTISLANSDSHTFDLTLLTGIGFKKLVLVNKNVTDWATQIPIGPAANLLANRDNSVDIYTGNATVTGII